MPAPLLLIFRSLRFGSDRVVLSLIFIYYDDPLAFRLSNISLAGDNPGIGYVESKMPSLCRWWCVGAWK
jgi:hypothetical protein